MSVLSLPVKRKRPEDATKPSQQKRPCRRIIPAAITKLPTDIIINIMSRVKLPIQKILADGNKSCLGCSKNELRSVFSDSKFAQAQSEYPRTCIFSYDPRHNDQRRFFLIENDDEKTLSMGIDMSFMEEVTTVANLDVLTSCNGLLLLGFRAYYDSSVDCQLWVANPLTKEFTSLPQPELQGDRYYYALGFDEKKSNKYKVVRFVCRQGNKDSPSQWSGEILTGGTQSWRKIDGCDQILKDGRLDEGPVVHKGSLHWVASVSDKDVILRLDLETEEFETVALPEELMKLHCCTFGIIDDLLYVGGYKILDIQTDLIVWVLDNHKGKWNWKKVIVIQNAYTYVVHKLVQLVEVNEDGEILFISSKKLVYYNPKTKVFRKPRVNGWNTNMRGLIFHPNLRSLKMYE